MPKMSIEELAIKSYLSLILMRSERDARIKRLSDSTSTKPKKERVV